MAPIIKDRGLAKHVGEWGICAWITYRLGRKRKLVKKMVEGKLVRNTKSYEGRATFAIKERGHPVLTNLPPGRTRIGYYRLSDGELLFFDYNE